MAESSMSLLGVIPLHRYFSGDPVETENLPEEACISFFERLGKQFRLIFWRTEEPAKTLSVVEDTCDGFLECFSKSFTMLFQEPTAPLKAVRNNCDGFLDRFENSFASYLGIVQEPARGISVINNRCNGFFSCLSKSMGYLFGAEQEPTKHLAGDDESPHDGFFEHFSVSLGNLFGSSIEEESPKMVVEDDDNNCDGRLICFNNQAITLMTETLQGIFTKEFSKDMVLNPLVICNLLLIVQAIIVIISLCHQPIFKTIGRIRNFVWNFLPNSRGKFSSNINEMVGNRQRSFIEGEIKLVRPKAGMEQVKRTLHASSKARNTTISAANAIQKRIAGSISDDDIPSNSASSKRITLSNASRLRILPPSLTPCRIPIFVDSPRPIRSSQIRRFNGSSVSMRLADIRPCNGRFRPGRPTRIPLFQNSPKPIRIEQVLSH